MDKHNSYHESLLHWIWENQHYDLSNLTTCKGLPLQVYDTGVPNNSDGPDFRNACVQIGHLKWYGDIEIHWNENDWYNHQHQKDVNYNNVILHVVYSSAKESKVLRKDGTQIPTFELEPILQYPLRSFLEQSQKTQSLPCANQFTYISEKALEQQLEKAHKEYFEKKVADIMSFYDPSLPVSSAWQNTTAIGLFDGLGISQNREPMQKLCKTLLKSFPESATLEEFIEEAVLLSGLEKNTPSKKYTWKHKGSRPNNHPILRIKQGSALLWYLKKYSIKKFITSNIKEEWKKLNAQIPAQYRVGKERKSILFGTVWMPALFMLGNLLHAKKLKTSAWENWKEYRVNLPNSLLQPLKSLPVSSENYSNKLGSIHQLRCYCKPRKCEACKVFKSVISA